MELKDFVAQTLSEIAEGVVAAQHRLEPIGAKVNPRLDKILPSGERRYEAFAWAQGEGSNPVLLVVFDVAVTASQATKSKGGIGVVAGVVTLGSAGATDKSDASVSRLNFKIPLLLPLHGDKRANFP